MVNKSQIVLKVSDIPKFEIDRYTKMVADYLSEENRRIIIKDLCLLFSDSAKWKLKDAYKNFQEKKKSLFDIYHYEDIQIEIILNELDKAFKFACSRNISFYNDLRGKLFEAILVGVYGGAKLLYLNRNFQGWGVSLWVHEEGERPRKIEYVDPKIIGKNNKTTFDYAYLDEENNYFYECKINPNGLSELEVGYFWEVHTEMLSLGVEHKICYFSSDNFFNVEILLAEKEALEDLEIIALGFDNIASFVSKHYQYV